MFGLGVTEIVVILVVALLFIGPDKLPDLARSLGKGLREIRKATDDIKDTVHGTVNSAMREVTRVEPPARVDFSPSPPLPGSGAAPPATEPAQAPTLAATTAATDPVAPPAEPSAAADPVPAAVASDIPAAKG